MTTKSKKKNDLKLIKNRLFFDVKIWLFLRL